MVETLEVENLEVIAFSGNNNTNPNPGGGGGSKPITPTDPTIPALNKNSFGWSGDL